MSFFTAHPALDAVGGTLRAFAVGRLRDRGLPDENFAFVLLSGTDGAGRPLGVAHRADWRCYPCSLVKVFFLVAAEAALEEGRLSPHEDLDLAMRDMILWSSNTATNYVIDLLTGTTGDTLLPDRGMDAWRQARQAVNAYFAAYGWPELAGINLSQKLMDDLRYGRERASVGTAGQNHNALTPIAMARLMHALFEQPPLPQARAERVRDLLERDLRSPLRKRGAYQIDGYLGAGLPEGSRLWSKAGHTRWTGDETASFHRHDALRAELPCGRTFTLVAFSKGEAVAEDESFLPEFSARAVEVLDTIEEPSREPANRA